MINSCYNKTFYTNRRKKRSPNYGEGRYDNRYGPGAGFGAGRNAGYNGPPVFPVLQEDSGINYFGRHIA